MSTLVPQATRSPRNTVRSNGNSPLRPAVEDGPPARPRDQRTRLGRADPQDRYRAGVPARVGDTPETSAVLQFITATARGGSPVTDTVEQVLGRPGVPFAHWAREHAEDFA